MIMFLELLYTEMAPSSTKRSEVEIELVFWLLRRIVPLKPENPILPLGSSIHQSRPVASVSSYFPLRQIDGRQQLPDYKALFLQAEKRRKEAEERQKQAEDEGRREKMRREQEEERRKQAEDEGRQEKERREQAEERTRPTTFVEFLRHSHDLLSRPLSRDTISLDYRQNTPLPRGNIARHGWNIGQTAQHNCRSSTVPSTATCSCHPGEGGGPLPRLWVTSFLQRYIWRQQIEPKTQLSFGERDSLLMGAPCALGSMLIVAMEHYHGSGGDVILKGHKANCHE
ncbi:unnamed protein product [Penicillium camemberti]|uniref:Str. FM013 n=1 Tax=Penicillium camemberti (strain FM 013) TaxID=1429867 RepID=A0A0G4PTW5_PENC3|nr:unnamed protein product [Penicillium camemberti]